MRFLDSDTLKEKGNMIMVSNVCNWACGGCNQFCPNIRQRDHWSITLDQLRENLDTMTQFHQDIVILGGEPTTHPEWEDMKTVFQSEYPHITFWVATNHPWRVGCEPPESEQNINYHCENEMRSTGHHVPTLVAPIDIYQIPDRRFYVYMARKFCWMLDKDCSALLYNNRAYFCQVAAGFAWGTGAHNGWRFESGLDPFDRTEDEIMKQALSSCFRCAFCMDDDTRERFIEHQMVGSHSLITSANANFFKRRVSVLSEKEAIEIAPDAAEIGQAYQKLMNIDIRRSEEAANACDEESETKDEKLGEPATE